MNKLLLLGEITAIKKSNIKIILYFIPPTSSRREENKGKQKIPTVCLAAVALSVSGWAEPRGVTDTIPAVGHSLFQVQIPLELIAHRCQVTSVSLRRVNPIVKMPVFIVSPANCQSLC